MTLQLPQLHTNSSTTCYQSCARKYLYRYVMGVRPVRESQALRLGSAVHLGLELAARGVPDSPAATSVTDPFESELVSRLLLAYHWYWGQQDDPNTKIERYISVEESFEQPIKLDRKTARGHKRAGKRDGIALLDTGQMALVEHKTASGDISPTSDYWTKLAFDSQISLYWDATLSEGVAIDTVLYDVIRKPDTEPRQVAVVDEDGVPVVLYDDDGSRARKKNGEPYVTSGAADGRTRTLQTRTETPAEYGERVTDDIVRRPDYYFQRQQIPRLESDLAEFRKDFWDVVANIRDAHKHGRWPRNTSQCRMYSAPCEYVNVCGTGLNLNDIPAGFARVSNLHPELKGS